MTNVISHIDFLLVYILLTCLAGCIFLSWKVPLQRLILFVLLINSLTELSSSFFLKDRVSIGLIYNVYNLLHHSLWIYILIRYSNFKKWGSFVWVSFILFALTNMFWGEGINNFNYYTFVLGAFMYLFGYVFENFYKLKQEDYEFFQSNAFKALSAPIIFMFGFSLLFGFKNNELNAFYVFQKWKLYDFISNFVNVIYYGMLLWYIYSERKTNTYLK